MISQLEQYQRQITQALRRNLVKHLPEKTTVQAAIRAYNLRPGKKIRSLVLLLSYLGYSKKPLNENIIQWASSLEILQNFMLIHDDLVDQGAKRRGGKALHLQVPKDVALIAGDALYAIGLNIFLLLKAKPQNLLAAYNYLLKIAVTTAAGEMADLTGSKVGFAKLQKKDLTKAYINKTAGYTFCLPLVCGALAAGCSSDLNKLIKIGNLLGLAYQLKDDNADLHQTDKTRFNDLKQGKKTLLILETYRQLSGRDRTILSKLYQKKQRSVQDILRILSLIRKTTAVEVIEEQIEVLLKKAKSKIVKLSCQPNTRKLLISLLVPEQQPGACYD